MMTYTRMHKSGYVYVIRDESERRKLGMAENVLQRKDELQTGNAEILTIEHTLFVKDMKRAEDALHQLFAAGRIRANGEWFVIHDMQLLQKIFGIITLSEREQKLLESLGLR